MPFTVVLKAPRSASSNILTATYGWPRITEEHTDLVKRIHAHTDRLSNACIPGTSMVDIFPFLNYLPLSLAKFKRDAFEWHDRESRMFERFNDGVAKQVVSILRYFFLAFNKVHKPFLYFQFTAGRRESAIFIRFEPHRDQR